MPRRASQRRCPHRRYSEIAHPGLRGFIQAVGQKTPSGPAGLLGRGDGVERSNAQQVMTGTETAYDLAKKHKLKLAWGIDILFDATRTKNQGAMLAALAHWFTNAEALRIATSTNAELLAMSGPRNPYPGKIGVIEAGAYADLLLVEGDPTADIHLVSDPAKNFKVIMKDGCIYKNTLAG